MQARTFALVSMLCCGVTVAHAADEARVVNEGGIRDAWMLADGAKLATPSYPAAFAHGPARDVCLALGYEIAPDGSTGKFRVLKQWNSDTEENEPVDGFWAEFAQTGADALAQWKFKPRPEVTAPQPTFTVATLTWQTRKETDPAALRAHCKIDDLVAHLKKVDQDTDITDHAIDRANRARDGAMRRAAGTPRN